MFKFIFCLLRRDYQQQAESADAKLQALNSRLNELRERFKQAQREVEAQDVRFERISLEFDCLTNIFSVNAEISIGG